MSNTNLKGPITRINIAFLQASLGFAMAWLLWTLAVPGYDLFKLFAAACTIGGAIRAAEGLILMVKYVSSQRERARYKSRGATPKADRMASDNDLRKKGVLK